MVSGGRTVPGTSIISLPWRASGVWSQLAGDAFSPRSHVHLMLLAAEAAVVLKNCLFRLQMSLVARTKLEQKHDYAVLREALVQRESGSDS